MKRAADDVRRGPRAWLFAALLVHAESADLRLYGARKQRLFERLHAAEVPPTILEIGAGAGMNARYFPRGSRWLAVEPNAHFHRRLRRAARRWGLDLSVVGARAERVPLPDASADVAVSTLVLCSVADVPAALAEVRRVLKPGGRLFFVEHVAAPRGTALRAAQHALRAPWGLLADGCRPDRDTEAALHAAGFSSVEAERFDAPVGLIRPHIAGVAVNGPRVLAP